MSTCNCESCRSRRAVVDRCSCDESVHLRAALEIVRLICVGDTHRDHVADLAQCANIAAQGLALAELEGDPSVYNLSRMLPRLRAEDAEFAAATSEVK